MIRMKIDFSSMGDNNYCYADHKFPAKSDKLTQEYVNLGQQWRQWGQHVYDKKWRIEKIRIKQYLHKMISRILVNEK